MENIPRPTCGRIVNFVAPSGQIRAAIVMSEPGPIGGAEEAYDAYTVELTVFYHTGPGTHHRVAYSAENNPGSWHWMPYQLGQAKFQQAKAGE
jgi:hypothetical protein